MRGKNHKLIAWVIAWVMIITIIPNNAIASDDSVMPEVTAGFDGADQSKSGIIENQDVGNEKMNPDLYDESKSKEINAEDIEVSSDEKEPSANDGNTEDENNKVSEFFNEKTKMTVNSFMLMSDVSQNESNGEFEANASLMYGAYYKSIPYVGILVETNGIPASATAYGVKIDGYKYPATSAFVNGKFVVDVANNPQVLIAGKEYTAKVYYTEDGEDVYADSEFSFCTPASMLNINGYYYADGDNVGYSYTDKGIDVMGKDGNGNWIQSTFSTDGWPMAYGNTTQVKHYSPAAKSVYSDKIDAWVVPEISDDGYFVKVKYYIRNVTNDEITDFRFGASADVQIGSQDYAPISKTEYGLELSDGTNTFALLLNEGYTETPVTTKWFGIYSEAAVNVYENIGSESLSGKDSGAAYSWQNITIAPGEVKNYEVMLGVGDANTLESLIKPNAAINYANETISGLIAGSVYIITVGSDEYTVTADANGEIAISGTDNNAQDYVLLGNDISIAERKEIDGVVQVSTPQNISVGTRPNVVIPDYHSPDDMAPELPDDLDITTTDSSITIKAEDAQEYSIDGGETWVTANGDGNVIFTGLNDGTVYNILTRVVATSSSFASESEEFDVKTSKMLTITDVDISGETQTYDGSAKMLTIYSEGTTASYSTTLAGPYSATFPECVDVGTYTVYYKLSKAGYHDYYNVANLEIKKGEVSLPVISNKTYTGNTLKADVSENEYYTVSENDGGITVGQYDVVLTLKDSKNYKWSDGTETARKTIKFEIKKATANVITGLAIEGWTYGESAKTPSASATFGTPAFTYVGTGETHYAESATPPANAGTYKVIAKVAYTTNYAGASDEKTFSIAKATPNVSAPTAKTGLVYNGADKELVSAGTTSGGEMQYSLDNSTWTTEIPQGNSAGSYTVYYKVVGDNNYNDVAVQSISVSIAQANMSEAITADGYNGEFDNQAHTISVTIPDDASVKYGTTEGTYELETAPTYTNKGNYKVYYKVEKANHNTITGYADVVITAKDISNAEITLGEALTFNGTAQTQAITSATVDGLTITYDVSGNENTNAGDYTLTITGNGNFTGTTQKTYTIAKATPSVSAPTAKTGLVYNGADKELVSAGTTSGGEMQYSLDNSTWTTEIPQSNSAGSYTVYYKVVGGTNYNDNAGGTVQVTIAKAQIAKPSADSRTFTYTGNEQTYNVTASDYYTVNGTTRTDAGSQNVTVALKDKNNYEWADGTTDDITFTFNIGKADAEITINGDTSIVKTYGDIWELPTASSTFGTVTKNKTEADLKNAGTYTVTYSVEETENYNGDTKTVSVTVNPLPVNITWENTESLVYDGNEKTITPVVANKVSGDTFNFVFDGTSTLTATEKGTYTVTVTDVGNINYTLTGGTNLTKTWAIAEAANEWTTPLSITGWIYGGTANEPTAASKFGTPVYTYANSVDGAYTSDVPTSAGTWYVKATVAGATSYAEISDTKEFVITEKELNADSITAIGDVTFTGEEIKPAVEVRDGNTILVLGTDYEVAYQDNTNAGTAKVIITFKGNYKGTPEKSFTILPKKINPSITLAAPVSNETPVTSIETDEYTATVVWSPAADDKFAYSTEYTATVTVTPKANYTVTGITENEYTIEGAIVTNTADSGNITAVFAKTGSRPSSGGGVSKYTVKFETNGGTTVANKSVTRNALLAEPTAPTKDGYTFDGWYTDKELTTAYNFDTKVTKGFTLYAKWTEIEKEPEDTDVHNCPSEAFTDLDTAAWYHLDTDYVIENGIFKGTTENIFEPNTAQTRAMMVTVLYRAEGEPAVNKSIPFADIDMGAYYANAVIWAQQNGIVKGVSETEFAPDNNITRDQIAAIMFRYAQYKGIDVSVGENTNILSYDDFDDISEYAISAIQWTCGSGLIKGRTESTLNPKENATRAEIAAILHRFIEANK